MTRFYLITNIYEQQVQCYLFRLTIRVNVTVVLQTRITYNECIVVQPVIWSGHTESNTVQLMSGQSLDTNLVLPLITSHVKMKVHTGYGCRNTFTL